MIENIHEQNREIVKAARKANEERAAAHSKNTLKTHLTTKFKTTMIGTLAIIEEHWGHEWGHGLDESDCTPEQLEKREEWNLIRTELLNNGNNQLRAALSEVDMYTVNYNKFRYVFPIVKPGTKERNTNE